MFLCNSFSLDSLRKRKQGTLQTHGSLQVEYIWPFFFPSKNTHLQETIRPVEGHWDISVSF